MSERHDGSGGGAEDSDSRKIAAEFEAAWQAAADLSEAPQIGEFLQRPPEARREILRNELQSIDDIWRARFADDSRRQPTVIVDPASDSQSETDDPANQETFIPSNESGKTVIGSGESSKDEQELDFDLRTAGPNGPRGYEILGELGRGGMGVVYRARQTALNRVVALKMILSGDHSAEEELLRFRDEAEAVAHLQHPNIVQIYEIGELSGLPYFSLEFVDGTTLQERVQNEPLTVQEAARLIETLARAIQYAHEQGIIHRDLKPGNILLTVDGVPKITDFGLAKQLETDSSRTRTGTIVGTPKYMAPEQAQPDRAVGPLTDVYALGAILYELIAGRAPFLAATPMETVLQVLNDEPVPPSRLRPKLPRDLETICLKCLQKEPDRRYPDARALAEDLRRFQSGEPIVARPISDTERLWRWCKRKPVVATLSALSILLTLTVTVGSVVAAIRISHERNVAVEEKQLAELSEKREKFARKDAEKARDREAEARREAETAREEADRNYQLAGRRHLQTLDAFGLMVREIQSFMKDRPSLQPLRQSLLETASNNLNVVAETAGRSTESDLIMAGAERRMGELFLEMGEADRAREHFERCLQIAETLREEGQLPRVYENMAAQLNNLGEANLTLGETDLARDYFLRALDWRKKWHAANANSENNQFYIEVDHIADSHYRLGKLALLEGKTGEALDHYKFLRDARERWAGKDEDHFEARQNLAGAYTNLGDAYQRAGDLQKAFDNHSLALSMFETFEKRDGTVISNRFNVAVTLDRLAGVSLWMGEFDKARSFFERTISYLEALSREDPLNATTRRALALAYAGLGITLRKLEDPEFEALHRKSLELQKELYKDQPDDARGKAELMHAYARSGDYRTADELASSMEEEYAGNSRFLMHVASCYAACAAAASRDMTLETGEREGLKRSFAGRAMDAARKAVSLGFNSTAMLQYDPDFEAIRNRPDFADLLDAIRQQAAEAEKSE